ncbi:MAG TPA: DNA-formamidopyrimidine glycosylase [Candidatus Coprovivens excrementavium]|nr:DNA-formamidopyrimidine glycosylase [Candidatus Coprovivens excrementavium]
MPEIAEVETVRQTLKKRILNKKIKNVNVLYERIIESDLEEFKKNLIGLEFKDILRKGKWLLFDIGDYYLCSHLRMEGKYFIKKHDEVIDKHEHVIFSFEDGTDLRYHDTRKFGRMNLVLKDKLDTVEGVRKQGIEPIDSNLTKEYLYEKFHKKKLPMKTLLLDQTIISGLGNIYADEVLFGARIKPMRLGNTITLEECDKIVKSSREIIEEAIKCGGTTIRSYTSSLGVTGRFQQNLMVHKRENEECKICHSLIKKIVIGGRSTYYCEKCQL